MDAQYARRQQGIRPSHLLPLIAAILITACLSDLTGPPDLDPPEEAPERAKLVALSGGDQSGVVGGLLPSTVRILVTDSRGTHLPGIEVRFRIPPGQGGSADGAVVTNAGGVAEARWTLGPRAAMQWLEVELTDPAGLRAALTVTAIAVPGPAAVVDHVGWNGYAGTVVGTNEAYVP